MNIHPTAVVDPEAEIGPDVEIGPYCVIGPEVTIGAGLLAAEPCTLLGPVKVGAGNRFHAFCSIGQQTSRSEIRRRADLSWRSAMRIRFREFVTVNRATAVGSSLESGTAAIFSPTAISLMIA